MEEREQTVDRLRRQARTADDLHECSRGLLEKAARSGRAAGLTQREIATAIGRSQPEVSRLLRFQGRSELGRALVRNRRVIREIAEAYGATNLRIFGSVARGTDGPESDIDLLADITRGTGLFALARLERELAGVVGAHVEVVPAQGLRKHLADRVLSEAVPL